jgi:muramoyltetrapeptide carboxypeptidase
MSLNRRELVSTLALSGAAAAFAGREAAAATASTPIPPAKPVTFPAATPPLVKPPKLGPGSVVGLVLPASQAFEQSEIDVARQKLEAIGFKVKEGAHVRSRYGYFAGTDAERASDVNAMFADDSVDGVYCFTGGWGTPRILPLLDYEVIAKNPKVIIGYSDVTSLVNTIHQRTGLVTFHGPLGVSEFDPWSLAQLERVLFSTDPIGVLTNPPKPEDRLVDPDYHLRTVSPGKATGRIVGGNLSMLSAMMGTPYEVATAGGILFIEDIHEGYYRIDRMLTQMLQGGSLSELAGVVWGYCTDCTVDAPSFSLEEVLDQYLTPLGIPALAGLAFGHIHKKLTLPIGLTATLDADAGTLTIPEAAVV